ncbi:MAG: helix-turn-helix domain-containing protein [Tsuneonella suprasediminis]|nr:helix-turn-helix domain-containing protein [Altererythrobacter sp. N1]
MDQDTATPNEELPLHGAGDRLRLAREAAGMTIEQVAAETRIPLRHLEVIEAGDFGALPARTYAIGFSRTYARMLGLDEKEILDDVRAQLGATDYSERQRVATFEPGDPTRVPSRGLTALSVLAVLLLLVGGFMFYTRVVAPGAGPASLLGPDDAPAASASATAAPRPAAKPAAVPASGPVVFTSDQDGMWIKFYDADGKQLMQKQMAKGESYTVPADAKGPMAWTGRPDAFSITVGGRAVPKLSDEDKVMKDVPVTAAALLGRAAQPAAQPTATGN